MGGGSCNVEVGNGQYVERFIVYNGVHANNEEAIQPDANMLIRIPPSASPVEQDMYPVVINQGLELCTSIGTTISISKPKH